MDERASQVADQLLLIEHELRQLGWWQSEAPSAEALASQTPFCVDTLAFEQWLQWILLPRMKMLLENDGSLPSVSGIKAMAEMAYREQPVRVRGLLDVLGELDRVLTRA